MTLEEYIKKLGLTKSALADRVGVTPQFIGQITRGERMPSTETARSIEVALKLSPGALSDMLPSINPSHVGAKILHSKNMEGVEIAYLQNAIEALIAAREVILRHDIEALLRDARGKTDTMFFDFVTEDTIVNHIKSFDSKCAIFTEECSGADQREFSKRVSYFIDPLDRSWPLKDYLKTFDEQNKNISGPNYSIEHAFGHPHCMLHKLNAPFGSINCFRNSEICFNVMLNYVDGDIYVACKGMVKHGNIDRCVNAETLAFLGEDIRFEPREGKEYVTYAGEQKPQYIKHLKNLKTLNERYRIKNDKNKKPEEPERESPGGPARILYLSDDNSLVRHTRPAIIMSNGEKICEWFGWLAYACYSGQLRVYEVSAPELSTTEMRDAILLAPPLNYSIFEVEEDSCKLNLDRLTSLDKPVSYRSALLLMHRGSRDAVQEILGTADDNRCRELLLSKV